MSGKEIPEVARFAATSHDRWKQPASVGNAVQDVENAVLLPSKSTDLFQ